MSDGLRIVTNGVPRDLIDAWELSDKERREFDYLDWPAIERGEDSASFFRYRGSLYDLGEFMTTKGMPEFSPMVEWDGYSSDSYFSGVVVRLVDHFERVIVGTFLA